MYSLVAIILNYFDSKLPQMTKEKLELFQSYICAVLLAIMASFDLF